MVYWDEDERKDLLVGQSDGTVKIFLNVGTDEAPTFDSGALLKVGGYEGAIHIYYNCGCGGAAPHFNFSEPYGDFAEEDGHDLVVPGGRSSPAVADLDGDGLRDLLVGNTYGQLLFYKNIGLESLPIFSGYTPATSAGAPIDLPGSLRSRPSVCHWTGDGHFGPRDGYWDVLVGSGDGKIRLYRGISKVGDFDLDGDIDVDDLRVFVEAWRQPDPSADSLADLNADGTLDYLDLEAFVDLMLAAND